LRYRLVGRPLPGSPINDLRLPVSKFEAQIRHIYRRGFVPVSISEALARRGERAFLEASPIVLTFDGPYASFASAAFPILCRYRLNRATLFFPPSYLGETELSFPDGRAEPLLSPTTLRRLMNSGVTLAVQAPVRAEDEYDPLLAEFQAARRVLAQFCQQDPEFVSYSFSSAAASEAAREAGYKASFVLGDGIMKKRGDPFGIPRFGVQTDTELVQLAMVLARRASKG
jgi:peptidoglycan/xylan/chitin deacetylase (PgdA/CDA1 family)